jgi:fumarylacetoacetase
MGDWGWLGAPPADVACGVSGGGGPDADFPPSNLPYGIFSAPGDQRGRRRLGVAVGGQVLDLAALSAGGLLCGPHLGGAAGRAALGSTSLNAFMALGPDAWREAREVLTRLLRGSEGGLRDDARLRAAALHDRAAVSLHLPAEVGDYTDFNACRWHAANVGAIFRRVPRARGR